MAGKILWAVDPFIREPKLLRAAARLAAKAAADLGARVEPVYLFGTGFVELTTDYPRELIQDVCETGNRLLRDAIQDVRQDAFLPLRVIVTSSFSVSDQVDVLLRFAGTSRAELIVASTHARSGLKRLYLGSFAEQAMLHSEVPLLIVNPKWVKPPSFRRILFPTDFSDESREAFDRVVELARKLGARVSLFHRVPAPGLFQPAVRALPLYREMFSSNSSRAHAIAERWAAEAEESGARVSVRIETARRENAADAILRQAKEGVDLIAMVARGGPVESALVGSTTRRVARGSSCPVWIVHARKPRARAAREPFFSVTAPEIRARRRAA